ncbi:ATP-dependent DNA helicase RecG [Brevibacterium siliguriense]|uniref:ATP-dependent DNA helicase RecG n=1 Tax=Brevibacterium siliguriense TaxID=1136497 RepID=A0A1H1S114_9MICO|nr:ATP-dependent DNA helicase RecG [Brevibacterium siliguriense]SDS41661.1 ATP-dependent DNA helicase RecG [Brevibacterium siliguriense]
MTTRLEDNFRKADRTHLAKRGVHSVTDLLRFFPRRYLVPGERTELGDLPLGETAIIQAEVIRVETRRMKQRKGTITEVIVHDGKQSMKIAFFNQYWLEKSLTPGLSVVFGGKVESFRGQLTLASPVWLNRTEDDHEWTPEDLNSPFPIYPAVKGIAQSRLWSSIKTLLTVAGDEEFEDPLPKGLREAHELPDLRTALEDMHRPRKIEDVERARLRWKWEEALALQTEFAARKAILAGEKATPLLTQGAKSRRFDDDLPFTLTASQVRVGEEIAEDMAADRPMHRLLHGDVGSGKTLVALRAMLTAVDSGAQAAMLAPTEVLATQHFHSIQSLLDEQMALSPLLSDDDQVTVALMTGSMPAKDRRELAVDLVTGNIDIVVGTHALLSESTMFAALGLIVVDEQHRFGVEQREALRAKGGDTTPHTLVMSATPIPRTVAMTVFADLDISTLKEMPAGPKDIATHVVPIVDQPAWYVRVRELMRQTVEDGRGVFVVFPRIEPTDIEDPESGDVVGQKQGIEDITRKLSETPELAGLKFGLLHGRMSTAEKDRVLADFVKGDIEILVSTTVIEVGVDVARATMMVIIEAENFGVAQLHQLRGRVGRDGNSAMCFLLTEMSAEDESYGRLQAVAETLDGFALAEYDLAARGEGDVLSGSQWGGSSLRHLSILRDSEIVAEAKTLAEQIVAIDPTLEAVPALKAFIRRVLPEDDAHFIEAG